MVSAGEADDFPQRPVTLVVPSPAGGTTDVVARIVAKHLGALMGQSFVVENRAGANGYIGTNAVLRAPKDGYTYAVMSGSLHSFTPSMVESMPFDPIDDFELVSRLISYPYVLVTAADSPLDSMKEVVETGRGEQSKLSYGSYGVGSAPHLITEWFKLKTGVRALHVPYKGGGQSSGDLIGGRISMMFSSLPAASAQIRAGQIKALAMTSAARQKDFPDVPAVAETIPDFEAVTWLGLGAAKGTPPAIVDKLRAALQQAAQDPAFTQALKDLGAEVTIDPSAETFRNFLLGEKKKWDAVVAEAGIPKQAQ